MSGLYKEFTYWNCYLVLMDSEKFRAGVDAGWPKKQRLNLAGDHSSSSGSHELPDDVQEFPTPPSFTRRTRLVGQMREQRAARGGARESEEVQSASPPSGQSPAEIALIGRQLQQERMHKLIGEWRATTDLVEKRFLHDLLESIRVDLAAAAAEAGGSDAPGLGVPGSGEERRRGVE